MRDRFERLRLYVLYAVAGNAALALVLGLAISWSQPVISAHVAPGFMSDMLMIRNDAGRELREVVIELDGRYVHRTRILKPGLQGFELQRAFEDAAERFPPSGYRPRRLRVVFSGGVEEVPIDHRVDASP